MHTKSTRRNMLAALLAAVLFFGFACSPAAPTPPAAETPAPAAPEAAAAEAEAAGEAAAPAPATGALVGVSLYSRRSQEQQDLEAGLRAKAAELGISLLIEDADTDPQRQSEHLQGFIDKGVDLIIVNPTTELIAEKLVAAYEAGIPLVTMEVGVGPDFTEAHLGFDHALTGRLLSEWLAGYIQDEMGGSANIGIVDFASCQAVCQVKLGVIESELPALCPGAKIAAKRDGEGSRTGSMDAAEFLLKDDPSINLMLVFNADAADGARATLEREGRTDVRIVGTAYGDAIFDALAANDPFYAAMAGDPYYELGLSVMETADAISRGESVEPEENIIPTRILTPGNIAEYDYKAVAAKRGA